MTETKTFLGNGWAFPPRFSNDRLVMSAAEQDIRESLFILLSTVPGERVMQPAYGCALKSLVFTNINSSTVAIMKDMISKAILFFEARVIVDHIDINDSEQLQGKLGVHIYYRVRATNNRYNLVYPFYFNEATNASV